MSLAVAGHGALLAVTVEPVSAPGIFTTIAELNGDLTGLGLSRAETEVTPHQDDIDSYVTGVLRREPWSFSVNYVFGDDTHDALRQGLLDRTRMGFKFTGPNYDDNPTDYIIASGEVTSWNETNPVREGARTAEVTARMSKAMIVGGVVYGNVA